MNWEKKNHGGNPTTSKTIQEDVLMVLKKKLT